MKLPRPAVLQPVIVIQAVGGVAVLLHFQKQSPLPDGMDGSGGELFGGMEGKEFPLLVKIIDANDHLSIQVHPDDAYAFVQVITSILSFR